MTDALAPETELDPFGGEADMGAVLSERVLNQDEIDSLLGFDMGDGDDSERSGIRAIIAGRAVKAVTLKIPSVCPSAGARATASMAITPFAALRPTECLRP